MRRPLSVITLLLLGVVVFFIGIRTAPVGSSAQDVPGTHALTGSIEVNDGGRPGLLGLHGVAGDICLGGELLPLDAGYQVVVRDASQTIIGTGMLDFGVTKGSNACSWAFTVEELPETAFYQIQVVGALDEVRPLAWLVESEWTTTLNYRS